MPTAEQTLALFTDKGFGGPASVSVVEDPGAVGKRSTLFLLGLDGDPNLNPVYSPIGINPTSQEEVDEFNPTAVTPQQYDLAINLDPTDSGYLDLYYYDVKPPSEGTGFKWYNKFKLTPDSYPFIKTITFNPTTGTGTTTVDTPKPIYYDLLTPEQKAAFLAGLLGQSNIQYNFENQYAVSALIAASNPREESGFIKVDLSFTGVQYVTPLSTWAPLAGDIKVHILISITKNTNVVNVI